MQNYKQPLKPGCFYHVYNRGNNGENLFYTHKNYQFFLRRYDEFLSPLVETYAFCLLPNHFHLLIRVKGSSEVSPFEKVKPLPHQAFQRLFTSYAMAINKQQDRTGSLFQKPFKRLQVNNTRYLANLVFYIHANPQLHSIVPNFRDYPWSSYNRILDNKPTALNKSAVVEWFSSPANYVSYHTKKMGSWVKSVEMYYI
jgi:REP element-mobilizing transposase RayT